MVGVLLGLIAGAFVFFLGVDPESFTSPPGPGAIALTALVMAGGAIVLCWIFPMTIGLATVGWTAGSIAGFIGAPFAGHASNMPPMALHFVLSILVAGGIRRAMAEGMR